MGAVDGVIEAGNKRVRALNARRAEGKGKLAGEAGVPLDVVDVGHKRGGRNPTTGEAGQGRAPVIHTKDHNGKSGGGLNRKVFLVAVGARGLLSNSLLEAAGQSAPRRRS